MTLVIYDISDDVLRNKLAERLKDFGLERIQRSAFIGDLNPQERETLLEILKRYVKDKNDRVDVFVICNKDLRLHRKVTIGGTDSSLVDRSNDTSDLASYL